MMRNIILILLVLILRQTECLYEGESCQLVGQNGLCIPLSQCQPVLAEVMRAGSPMPGYMRTKLQGLTCGFVAKDPMVCCMQSTSSLPSDQDVPSGTVNPDPIAKPDIPYSGTDDDIEEAFIRISDDDIIIPKDVSRHPNLSLLPTNCGSIETDRVLGGNKTRLSEMPWMVLLSYISRPNGGIELSCGGTLINERYVLTAAHCVTNLGTRLVLDGVVLGEYDITTDPDCEIEEGEKYCAPNAKNATIEEVIPHPAYSPNKFYIDDIALLRLSEPANFRLENMKPICLPQTPELQREMLVAKKGVVAGWGRTELDLQSPVLMKVNLPFISEEACRKAYSLFNGKILINGKKLCAGGIKDSDSCSGDSGGPIMFPGVLGTRAQYVQRGIVSFGTKPCGIGRLPGVYTNVAHYMDWILDNIRR